VRLRVHDLDSVDTAKQSVVDGLGITLLPEVAIADELATGVLRRINWTCPLRVATQFGFSRDRSSDAMLNALLLAARQVIGEQVAQQGHRRLAS
jgi:DNA-binding transcriptional LysR family regulator